MKKLYRHKYFLGYALLILSIVLFVASYLIKISSINRTSLSYQVNVLETRLHEQEQNFELLLKDTALVKRLIQARETKEDVAKLYDKSYFIYLYKKAGKSGYLRFWSTALVTAPDSILLNGPEEQFVQLANGYYYIKKKPLPGTPDLVAYCLILLKSQFFITTDYLRESFPLNKNLDKMVGISLQPTAYPIETLSGKTLFYINPRPNVQINKPDLSVIVIRVLGLFLICISLYFILFRYISSRNRLANLLLFVVCMLAFRAALYVFKDQIELNSMELFNPFIYGASMILPSLGDLLMNSMLFCLLGIFIWNQLKQDLYETRVLKYRGKWLRGSLCIALLILMTFAIIYVIRSIIADSKISFDVTNFFSLNIYTAVGFIVLAFLCLGYYYFSRLLFSYLFPAFDGHNYWVYLSIVSTGMIGITLFTTPETTIFYLICLGWLLLYTFLFQHENVINAYIRLNISGIILWIFLFSISISVLMLSETNKVEMNLRKLYVEKLATQTDPATERLIGIANKYLNRDFFLKNFNRLYDPVQNQYLRDSILSNNYFRYLNDYATSLYFFDSTNNSVFNPDSVSLESLNTIITQQSRPTLSPDLFFYEPAYDKFAYITYLPLKNKKDQFIGTVYIVSNPRRKFSVAAMSPELFRQYNEWELSNSTIYNYAIYTNKLLTASSKKYPFTSTLVKPQIPKKPYEIRYNEGYTELWHRAGPNKVVVMARKNETVLETITLFSYIFCSFLFLVALTQVVSYLIGVFLNKRFLSRKVLLAPTIRGQIHSTFILITVLSFVVIGIATISFFTQRFEDSNAERLGRTMNIMLNEMQSHRELGSLIYEQREKGDSINSNELENIIKRVADIHGVDANIYDFSGRLLASSQPDIYTKGVLSTQIDPLAFYYLFRLRHIEHIQKEKISNLQYTSIYAPVRNADGSFNAYLSIPYFTSQQALNQEISNFLVTLINLNAFIFLITGLVALLITNRITRSFMLISDKMKKVNLSKDNEMIVWERKDEIGGLVTEYNKMVGKLKESADSLARSERQVAWREMARQVAHEIKNPLTPMKLSLQYLQKAIYDNSPNVQQLTANVSKTLVEQIDHLSKIAADFSQFANINNVNKEFFDLHEIIQPLMVIYSKNPDVDFAWQPLPHPIHVSADRTQVNRVFTNLFVNAMEACNNKKCKLVVKEQLADEKIIVSIKDNGSGIAKEMQAKVFTPNFTTKSSGTGLGLAMCKTILEQTGGGISFDTEPGFGTTFYLSFPLVS